MSSVDYKAFVQSEIEDFERLADVYIGADTDTGDPSEHMSIEHLNAVLSMPLPRELRSLYLDEYAEIRSSVRAIALCGLKRGDFYTHAAQMALSDRAFLSNSLARNSYIASLAYRGFSSDELVEFTDLESEYISRKSEVQDRIKTGTGVPSHVDITDEDMVRSSMKDSLGTSSRGVSTGKKRA